MATMELKVIDVGPRMSALIIWAVDAGSTDVMHSHHLSVFWKLCDYFPKWTFI